MTDISNLETSDFIRHTIRTDKESLKDQHKVATRFPPEPNGYLHLGHAKAICINFELAKEFSGTCNLRFDDTNPEKEDIQFENAIKEDIKWLGYQWNSEIKRSSNYFNNLYHLAVSLIKREKAYVCDLSSEEIKKLRGTTTEKGRNCAYRSRSIEENLLLFEQMKEGKFKEGEKVLRAKIDMEASNLILRDPVIYRIKFADHHRTKNQWCIYPMYDFTHCLSDSIEGISYSLCSLEFENHRPVYDWFVNTLEMPDKPKQLEFARLDINYTILSKRYLKQLVDEKKVSGWGDPRMPTILGLKNRGVPSEALKSFAKRIGVSKKKTIIDMGVLEECTRDELNDTAHRVMCVLDPLKITFTNFKGDDEILIGANHPNNEELGTREIPFTKTIFIEKEDFIELPPKKFFRLKVGGEVRLRYSYVIKCDEVIKDSNGNPIELICSIDYDTLGKKPEGRKVKGVIHWVSESKGIKTQVNLYDRLFNTPFPLKEENFLDALNPDSLIKMTEAIIEPHAIDQKEIKSFQFERLGYFYKSNLDNDSVSFNRTVTLRDSWSKESNKK